MSRSETRLHTQTIMARVTTRRDDAILNTNNSQSSAWASKPSRSGGFWGWLRSGQVAHLRLQVVGQSDLVDELDLGFQEVDRSEEHTSDSSHVKISYAVF